MAKKNIDANEQVIVDEAVKKQYIGESEIEKIDGSTVKFVDGTEKVYTETNLKYLVTDEPKDATALRDILFDNVVPDILNVLEKHDIRKGDLTPLFEVVFSSYNRAWFVAVGKAFGTHKKGVHPETLVEDIRISDIKRMNTI